MANETPRFRFTTFDSNNDMFDYRGYKFSRADRVLLDRLLTYTAERHVHTGTGSAELAVSPPGPTLSALNEGGALPANTTVYYRTVTVDERGQELTPSQVSTATTSPPIPPPTSFLMAASTGVLMAGDYVYAVSAYGPTPGNETRVSHEATGLLPAIGGWSIFLPTPPSGAKGFNIYRKGPTDRDLRFVTSVESDQTLWNDNGTIEPDPLRGVPTANTTSSSNSIRITPPTLGAGHTLKIYRTFTPSNWDRSLLVWTAVTPVTDTGHATREGAPTTAVVLGNPPKIDLGTETEGDLPQGLVATNAAMNFSFVGSLDAPQTSWQWISEFDLARVQTIRAGLARDASPAATPVIVTLERRTAGTTVWHRYQNMSVDVTAEIEVGAQNSALTTVPIAAAPGTLLHAGDALRAVVLQDGGGATPTDLDLTVAVTLAVSHGSETASYTWETT